MNGKQILRQCANPTLLAVAAFAVGSASLAATSSPPLAALGERPIASAEPARAATIRGVLDRWQAVAAALGQSTALWRDMMSIQLSQMSEGGRAKLAALESSSSPEMLVTRYREFIAILGADIGARLAARSGNAPVEKVGAINDQLFDPITPCRVVDTRSAGGQIGSFATRNFFFYTQSGTLGFDSQGGAPAPVSTSCPGAYNIFVTNGAPSAAVMTVTVVNQGGPGNLVAWGGASPVPTASALNYGTAANVGAIANTTVVPAGGRTGSGPGGAIEDFAINVNAFTAADVVVDVVGYFAINQATPLDCVRVLGARFDIPAGMSNSAQNAGAAPSCPAGYLAISANARKTTSDPGGTTNVGGAPMQSLFVLPATSNNPYDGITINCHYGNSNAFDVYGECDVLCCRIPGH